MIILGLLLGIFIGIFVINKIIRPFNIKCSQHYWITRLVNGIDSSSGEYLVCQKCGMLPTGDYEESI